MTQLTIETADGACPAYAYGAGPSVLMFIDGLGMRPAMRAIAEQLAAAGYRVLLPDLFWRMGQYTPPDPATLFSDPAVRADWWKRMVPVATAELILRDTQAYLAALPGPVGIVGYCMGGRMAIAAAGTFPDRIAAAAAYHPGGMVTDAADSAHVLASAIKAQVYIGGASDDASFPPEHQQRLTATLDAAHVRYELEIYPAKHGWVPSDTPVHDPVQAERARQTMEALFARTLK